MNNENVNGADELSAQKIPPRLADRLGSHGFNRDAADNLPALQNQLQMAMEIFQQAMEKNLAEERRRLRRSMWIFVITLAATTMTLLAGAGWLVYRLQLRMENIVMDMAQSQVGMTRPPTNPTPVTPPTAPPAAETDARPADAPELLPEPPPAPPLSTPSNEAPGQTPEAIAPAPAPTDYIEEDLRILQELQSDMLAVEEKSRALDDLLTSQQTRLQTLMLEVLDFQDDITNSPPIDKETDEP